MNLTFDYKLYFQQNCIAPLILLLLAICLLTVSIIYFFKKSLPKKSVKDMILLGMSAVLFVFMIVVSIKPLLNGGIYLLTENEYDAVTVTGVVEDTVELDFATVAKYAMMQNAGNGEAVVVNGKKYYLTSYSGTKKGDKVTIKVLPKSRFILKMDVEKETK